MNRSFPITDIASPSHRLKQPLEVVQERTPEGTFRAYAKNLALGFEGGGETWSDALQDFLDSFVTAAEQGLEPEVSKLVEPRPEPQQVTNAVPQTYVNVPAPSGVEVYVLIELPEGEAPGVIEILGVTTDAKWARRWKRWNKFGDFKRFTLNELPEADDEEA